MSDSQGTALTTKGDLDRSPSRLLYLGYTLSLVSVLLFAALYAFSIFQLDFWQNYFYYDSIPAGKYCTVKSMRSSEEKNDTSAFAKLKPQEIPIPHSTDQLYKVTSGTGDFIRAKYDCEIPVADLIKAKKEVTYLHLGWLVADYSSVMINGRLVSSFKGNDKLSIPLTESDLSAKVLHAEIDMNAKKPAYFGICGRSPMVLTEGNLKNNKVFGLEIALQQVRQLYNILPALTLALFLVLAWISGVRSRLVVVTFCFLMMVLLRNIVLLWSEFWPWPLFISYNISIVFQGGTILFFLVFALELLQVAVKYIPRLMLIAAGVVLLELCGVAFLRDDLFRLIPLEKIHYGLNLLACIYLIWAEGKNRSTVSLPRQKINRGFVYTVTVFALLGLLDYLFTILNIPVRLSYKIDIIMPLYIGGVVFYTLSLIEKEFREEKAQRAQIERDLDLARHIQDSLSPPKQTSNHGRVNINCFQKKHQQVAGDWLALRPLSGGKIAVVVADATGKGMQAALVIHAVQSLWAEELDFSEFHPDKWLNKVNRTLRRLGERQVHSLTAGILIISDDTVEYWSAGHLPAYVIEESEGQRGKVKAMVARGGVLGISDQITLESQSLPINPQMSTMIMLGSDGIFPQGTRTKPSEILESLNQVRTIGAEYIEDTGADDDRTLVLCAISKVS